MAEKTGTHGETIMVVDDAPDTVRLIQFLMEREGYKVVTASNGEDALRLARSERPDLVILDVMMPGMDGLEMCQRLRERPETADVPIIMLSALTQAPDKVKGLRAGADDYVAKPVDRDEIVARVAVHLNRVRRLRQAQAPKRGKVFCFMGAKGGVGTTTVALNVAALLVQQKKTTIALELRPSYGTFALQLKWSPAQNLTHLLELEPCRINSRELSGRLYNSPTGLKVLFGPQKAEEFKEVDPARAEAIVELAVQMSDYVVVDLPSQPSPVHQVAAQLCDLFTLVLEPEPASVGSAKTVLQLLQTWGVIGIRVGAVVSNRTGLTTALNLREIGTQLGCQIIGVVLFAGEGCVAALGQGVPLVLYKPENVAATTLKEMVGRLTAETVVGIRL
jgi:DNA-binding response OmpR family regulator